MLSWYPGALCTVTSWLYCISSDFNGDKNVITSQLERFLRFPPNIHPWLVCSVVCVSVVVTPSKLLTFLSGRQCNVTDHRPLLDIVPRQEGPDNIKQSNIELNFQNFQLVQVQITPAGYNTEMKI